MPHISVKLWPGRSEEQKKQLADQLTRAAINSIQCSEKSISVTIEEVEQENWNEVYKKEILEKEDVLYKKPGYNPFEK